MGTKVYFIFCAASILSHASGHVGIGAYYGQTDYEEANKMLTYACDNGVTFWDTADQYGNSEYLYPYHPVFI